ncbi:hypothetical protein BJ742DRAFT_888924 [Cladochytrium replicatum]|nr:hypothetical protein BJ742DRAFT_888924 [Cladochytrium replicatum]
MPICEAFGTPEGCLNGKACPNLHVSIGKPAVATGSERPPVASTSGGQQRRSSMPAQNIQHRRPKTGEDRSGGGDSIASGPNNSVKGSSSVPTNPNTKQSNGTANGRSKHALSKGTPTQRDSPSEQGPRRLPKRKSAPALKTSKSQNTSDNSSISASTSTTTTTATNTSRPPVSRPTPTRFRADPTVDPDDPRHLASLARTYELDQLHRRYPPIHTSPPTTFTFTLPVEDPDFPYELERLELEMRVPGLYPLDRNVGVKVLNAGVPEGLRRRVEAGVGRRVGFGERLTLLGLCRWLNAHLEELLKPPREPVGTFRFVKGGGQGDVGGERRFEVVEPGQQENVDDLEAEGDGSSTTDSFTDSSSEDEEEGEEEGGVAPGVDTEARKPDAEMQHRGVQIRLPNAKLTNFALITCTSLSILLSCARCKSTIDAVDVQPGRPVSLGCGKCNSVVGVGYRKTPGFSANGFGIGYLDLGGAKVVDLLPSGFVGTCSVCVESGGLVEFRKVTRGTESSANCRTCFKKCGLVVDEVRFVNLAPSAAAGSVTTQRKKKPRDETKLVIGEALPHRGACKHYRKSYRWFRFPCCGKLYACDECHDEAVAAGTSVGVKPHEMEYATRMVCGFCSREQGFVRDGAVCSGCGKDVVRGGGKGFWEGGQGTRERERMSRHEKRKFRGSNKTVSRRAAAQK